MKTFLAIFRYNKLTKNLSLDDEVYNFYTYDLNE